MGEGEGVGDHHLKGEGQEKTMEHDTRPAVSVGEMSKCSNKLTLRAKSVVKIRFHGCLVKCPSTLEFVRSC